MAQEERPVWLSGNPDSGLRLHPTRAPRTKAVASPRAMTFHPAMWPQESFAATHSHTQMHMHTDKYPAINTQTQMHTETDRHKHRHR